jgi:uncharacterized protein (DUF2236 family)
MAPNTEYVGYPPFRGGLFSEKEFAEVQARGLSNSDFKDLKRIVREMAVISGAGLPAVMLQIAHPGVGKGVGLHSNFAHRILDRSDNTAIYIYGMIYGTPQEKYAIRNFVDRLHAKVNDNAGPKTYNALDPALQMWVAATLYYTYVALYEDIFGKLKPDVADRVYQQFGVMGTALQVPWSLWPKDRAAFKVYWDDVVKTQLRVTPEAQGVLNDLWSPVKWMPLWLKPVVWATLPLHRATTIEQLPDRVARDFGLKSTKGTRRMNGVVMGATKTLYRFTPLPLRTMQKPYYMWLLRTKFDKWMAM